MRYLPLTQADRQDMLSRIGLDSTDALFADVPVSARLQTPVNLSTTMPEYLVERRLKAMAANNLSAENTAFFIGGGVYNHHVPASVDTLIQRGEFLTSYTPYQPEVSQGTLQTLFEFQTQVCALTGMEVANASLYDGSTSCVEAIMMAQRVTKRTHAVISGGLHPQYRQVADTYARMTGFQLDCLPAQPCMAEDLAASITPDTACVVVQYPDFFGQVHDYRALAHACAAAGVLLIAVCTEIVALGALEAPGIWGADIVAAEGQSLGIPMGFGGPHVGLFACKEKYLRAMPGRLCGQTVDAHGKRGFVLTLSTREQHIRREKATSNICTNSGLCALAFSIHVSLLGQQGLEHLAALNHAHACQLADRLATIPGVRVMNSAFFNEITIALPTAAAPVVEALAKRQVLAGIPLSRFYPEMPNLLLLAVTELTSQEHVDALITGLQETL